MKNKFYSWPEQQRGITSTGPIIVPCVATSGVGCDIAILLSGLNESTRFFCSQKFTGRQHWYQPFNHPIEERQAE